MELVITKSAILNMGPRDVHEKLQAAGFDMEAPIAGRVADNGDAVYSQEAGAEVPANGAQAASYAVAPLRVVAGLQEGRIVNYVLTDGAVRPMIVVNAWDRTGLVNGVLLFDGTNDNGKFAQPLTAGPSGHLPLCATWITSAPFDAGETPAPGSWNFPAKQACVASAVDPSALATQFEAFSGSVGNALANIGEIVKLKLQAHLEATNALIESALAEVRGEKLPAPVGPDYVGMSNLVAPTSCADLDMADHVGLAPSPETPETAS